MALNTEIDSLDAGAPELRLEGEQQAGGPYNTGSDVKNALNVWNNMGPGDRAEFDGFLDFFRSGAWRDQIQGMRQMQQQRKTAAQGGRMGFQTGALAAYQGGQNIMGPYDVSEYEAKGYSPGDLEFLSRTQIPIEAPDWYTQEQEMQKQHWDPTFEEYKAEPWEDMQEEAKIHMMREIGPYHETQYANPNARMMPPVGPVPLTDPGMMAGMDPGMMGPVPPVGIAGLDPSMITTPRDNQYNVAQWNKEEMLRKGVDPRMFASYGGTARPTYTQSRKQRMAGGGIAGLRQIGKPGGIVEPGISGYGMLDFITKPIKKIAKKVKEDIIPNELKAIASSPVGKAALIAAGSVMLPGVGSAIGQGLGSLGTAIAGPGTMLGSIPGMQTLGSLGSKALTGLGAVRTGATNLINRIPGVNISGGTEYSTTRPSGMDAAIKQMTGGGINPFEATGNLPGGAYNPFSNPFLVSGAAGGERLPQLSSIAGPIEGLLDADRGKFAQYYDAPEQSLFSKYVTDPLKQAFTGGGGGGEGAEQPPNWLGPLSIGTAMGAAQAAMPKDVIPTDTSGYEGGVGGIQRTARITPEALAATKGLHFVPQDVARLRSPAEEQAILGAAEGGRIGYGLGDLVKGLFSGEDETQDTSIYGEPETIQHGGKTYVMPAQIFPSRGTQNLQGDALQDYIEKNEDMKLMYRNNPNMMPSEWIIEGKAQGGRIGYATGSRDPKNMTTRQLIAIVQEGNSTPEIFIELQKRLPKGIEQLDLAEMGLEGDQAFKMDHDILSAYDPDKKAVEEEFLYDLRENNPDVYGAYKEPKNYPKVGYHAPPKNYDMAQGGRIGAQEGGLMNLGGMEKDYRQEGGFVPIGGQEKADDVPARLSKNEFVFTADAVRAAGGGDIDAGAEVMENVMENLEAGGRISETSQGLEGARNMFANAQRLEKRII